MDKDLHLWCWFLEHQCHVGFFFLHMTILQELAQNNIFSLV